MNQPTSLKKIKEHYKDVGWFMVDIYSPDKLLYHLGKLDTLKQNIVKDFIAEISISVPQSTPESGIIKNII